jgi:Tol biopolymer transport system component
MDTIVRMNASGGDIHVVRRVPGFTISNPIYAPDGTKIAYMQCEGDCGDPARPDTGIGSIWVTNADGSNPTEILVQQTGDGVPPVAALSWSIATS